jgi:hypothetical protein
MSLPSELKVGEKLTLCQGNPCGFMSRYAYTITSINGKEIEMQREGHSADIETWTFRKNKKWLRKGEKFIKSRGQNINDYLAFNVSETVIDPNNIYMR